MSAMRTFASSVSEVGDCTSGAQVSSAPLEHRFRAETLKIHRWQIQANLDLEAKSSALRRAEEGAKMAQETALERTAQARRAEQEVHRSEEVRHQLQDALRNEKLKARLAEEGLAQVDSQLTLQEQALTQVESWKTHSERRIKNVVEKVVDLEQRASREKRQDQEALAKIRTQLKTLLEEKAELTERLTRDSLQVQEERAARFEAESGRDALTRKLESYEQELTSLREKARALAEGEQELLLQLRAQEDKNDHQERCLQHVQEMHKEEKASLDEEGEIKAQKIEQLQTETAKYKATLAHFEERLSVKEKEADQSEEDNAALRETNAQIQEELKKAKEDLRVKCNDLLGLEGLVERKSKDHEEAAQENKRMAEKFKTTEEGHKEELKKAQQEVKETKTKKHELNLKYVEMDIELNRSKEAEEQLRKKVKDLEAKVSANSPIQSDFARPVVRPSSSKKKVTFSSQPPIASSPPGGLPSQEEESAPPQNDKDQDATASIGSSSRGQKRRLLSSEDSEDDDLAELFTTTKKAPPKRIFGRTYGGSSTNASAGRGTKRVFKARNYAPK